MQKYRCTIREETPEDRAPGSAKRSSITVKAESEIEARIEAKHSLNENHGAALENDDIQCEPNP